MKKNEIQKNQHSIVLYQEENTNIVVSVIFYNETFWLSQKSMAELFGCSTDNISLHLKNIFSEGELNKDSVTEKISATASDGKNYLTTFYNLDAVIAVGYRVNSHQATAFRIWATKTLKEYITKGFVLNDDMLKNGQPFGKDYFDELLERIREIRASERRAYQKIADVFEQCSYDYDKKSETTKAFYSFVQNKQWWFSVLDIVGAINGQDDHEKNRNYWKYLKAKLKKEQCEVVSATTQLKLTASDGKK